jgi:hypothetical protein
MGNLSKPGQTSFCDSSMGYCGGAKQVEDLGQDVDIIRDVAVDFEHGLSAEDKTNEAANGPNI